MSDIIITVIAIIAGSLMCFEGYKLFRLSLGLAGGVAGFIIRSEEHTSELQSRI